MSNRRQILTKAEQARYVDLVKTTGLSVTITRGDTTIVLSESTQEPLNDAFGKWAAKREGRSQRAASDKA